MIQGSPEWFSARCGKVTASRVADVMATIKNGEAATRGNYRAQLIAERLTGIVEEGYTSDAMRHGTEAEPFARAAYEIITGNDVEQIGFVDHPSIAMTGASPDGLVCDGLLEIKCPATATHLDYLLKNTIPEKYKPQMLWQMECTGRRWCDFVSFDPRLPDELRLFIVRFTWDEAAADAMRTAVKIFNAEVEAAILKLQHRIRPTSLAEQA